MIPPYEWRGRGGGDWKKEGVEDGEEGEGMEDGEEEDRED